MDIGLVAGAAHTVMRAAAMLGADDGSLITPQSRASLVPLTMHHENIQHGGLEWFDQEQLFLLDKGPCHARRCGRSLTFSARISLVNAESGRAATPPSLQQHAMQGEFSSPALASAH